MWRRCSIPTGAIEAPNSGAARAALVFCGLTFLLGATRAFGDPTPSEIMALHARAIHPNALAAEPKSTEILGYVEGNALFGTFHEYHEGNESRTEVHLDPLSFVTIDDGTHLWESDQNGSVRELTGVLRAHTLTSRFIESGAYVHDPKSVTFVDREVSDGRPCYEFAVQVPRGDRERICIDAKSYLLDRQEFDEGNGTTTLTFSDYRIIGGFPFAFRFVETQEGQQNTTTFTVDTIRENRSFDSALFERPKPRYVQLAAKRAVVSMRLVRSGYEVPVQIGTHMYWFLLDSGAQGIIIGQNVARDLGLQAVGRLRAVGASSVGGLGLTHIESVSIGEAKLSDLIVGVLDLTGATGGSLVADGVLGFPFFDAAIVRFDPHAMTLQIEAPGSNVPQSDGERLPIELDRQIPIVNASITDGSSAAFLVDTGSSAELLLYQQFVENHPGIVPVSEERRSGAGIGGALSLRGATLPQLRLGSVSLYNIRAGVVIGGHGAFADRLDAGNIGMGILKNFVITFDEPDGVLYLQRSADFDDGRYRPQYDSLTLPTMR